MLSRRPSEPGHSRHFSRDARPKCPLWVISGHVQRKKACPLYPRKRTPAWVQILTTEKFGPVETDAVKRMLRSSDTAEENPCWGLEFDGCSPALSPLLL